MITREITIRYPGSERKELETTLYEYGLLRKKGSQVEFVQETLQEYLCAQYLVANRVLPCDMCGKSGKLSYKGMDVEGMVRSFYLELSGFNRFFLQASEEQ